MVPLFYQNLPGCDDINYSVSYETVSGVVNSDWFVSDLTKIEFKIFNKEILSSESQVRIIINANIATENLSFLPKNQTSFLVVL